MEILVNIRNKEELNKNLALFKANLILQSIKNLNETKEVKEKVLIKVLEILDKDFKDRNI